MDLSQVYREHYRSLVRYLYRRIGDQARAEDLAQEAFVRALEHEPADPRPWLFAGDTSASSRPRPRLERRSRDPRWRSSAARRCSGCESP